MDNREVLKSLMNIKEFCSNQKCNTCVLQVMGRCLVQNNAPCNYKIRELSDLLTPKINVYMIEFEVGGIFTPMVCDEELEIDTIVTADRGFFKGYGRVKNIIQGTNKNFKKCQKIK